MQQTQPIDTAARAARPRPIPPLLACVLVGVWLAGSPARAGAELYRWVDETGTTIYSQRPPPGATPTTTLKPNAAPRPEETQRALDRLQRQLDQERDRRDRQARETDQANQQDAALAARRTACETARKNLEVLGKYGSAQILGPDGKELVLNKEQLAEQQAQARKQIQENCK